MITKKQSSIFAAAMAISTFGNMATDQVNLASSQAFANDAQYDDPAVVVCEMFKLGGQKPSTDLYRRTSSRIEGLTVTITFETAPLNTKPKSNSYSCSFHMEDEGFKINGENSSEYEKCSKLADAIMNNSLETPTEKSEIESLISEIKRCEDITINQMKNMISEFTSIEYPLNSLGIYPIKPEDTLLGK